MNRAAGILLATCRLIAGAVLSIGIIQQTAHTAPSPVAPPTLLAHPVVTEVERGGAAEIRLEALPSYGNQVRFVISSKPSYGSLGEIKRISPNVVSVPYSNNGGKEGADEFDFRIMAPGKCWATYHASLKIVDPPDSLQAIPTMLDFGSVGLGESESKKLVLKNRAAGLISGNLLISSPWRLSGDPSYSLRMGEAASFTITYEPREVGQTCSTVNLLPSDHGPRVTLKGEGILPFALSTKALVLSSEIRSADLSIESRLDHTMTVKVLTDDLLRDLPPLVLKPKEIRMIRLTCPRNLMSEMNTTARFTYGDYETGVAVRIPASAAATKQVPASDNNTTPSPTPLNRAGSKDHDRVTVVQFSESPANQIPVSVESGFPEIPKGPTLLPEEDQQGLRRLMVRDLSYFLKPGWIGWRLTLQWRYDDLPPKEFLIEEKLQLTNVAEGVGESGSVEYRRVKPRWIKSQGNGIWQASIPSPPEGFRFLRIAPVLEGKEKTIWATFQIQMPSNKLVWERYRGPLALVLLVLLVIVIVRIRRRL